MSRRYARHVNKSADMQQIQTKRGTLSYRTFGDPHMPPLVLLMGLGMPAVAWPHEFLERLVRKGLYVITPDNRDSGASTIFDEEVSMTRMLGAVAKYVAGGTVTAQYRLEDMAGDVEELLNVLGIERAHIAGISMGGMIAQVFATQAPHRTITLTCISSATGNPRTGLGNLKAVYAVLQPPKAFDDDSLRKYYRELMQSIGTKGSDYPDDLLNEIIAVNKKNNVPQMAQARQLMAILASGDRRKQLKQLMVPTLVIHGRADPLLPFRAGKEIADCIEGSTLHPIDVMGHDLPMNKLDEISQAIADHCYSGVLR